MATITSSTTAGRPAKAVVYPDSDGKPMADNTLQWQWINTIKNGLEVLFAGRPDVFVAGDLLWYPVEGDNKLRAAPDAMVVFGRPKGHRGSYRQWEENGVAPQVVFEVLSPGNRAGEMVRKLRFYERFGVLEYYLYDPGDLREDLRVADLSGWHRTSVEQPFEEIEMMNGWRSPQLGIAFQFDPFDGLRLIRPDEQAFETAVETSQRADEERRRADREHRRAEEEHQRAEEERHRADEERHRAERLLAQLRAAGLEPESGNGVS